MTTKILTITSKFPQPVTGSPWLITEFGHPRQVPVWESESTLMLTVSMWMRHYDSAVCTSGDFRRHWLGGVRLFFAGVQYSGRLSRHITALMIFTGCQRDSQPTHCRASWIQISTVPWCIFSSYSRRSRPDLFVASNADEVEIKINGKSLGRQKGTEYTHLPHPLFKFALSDSFHPGQSKRSPTARAGGRSRGVAQSAGCSRLQIVPDDSSIVAIVRTYRASWCTLRKPMARFRHMRTGESIFRCRAGGFLESQGHLEGGRIAFYVQAGKASLGPSTVRVSAEGLSQREQVAAEPEAGGYSVQSFWTTATGSNLKFQPSRR